MSVITQTELEHTRSKLRRWCVCECELTIVSVKARPHKLIVVGHLVDHGTEAADTVLDNLAEDGGGGGYVQLFSNNNTTI